MQNAKQHIALFYVALILLVKVASLHSFTHHTDDGNVNHCEVCEISTVANFTPLVGAEITEICEKPPIFSESNKNTILYKGIVQNHFLASNLYTRPPPPLS